MQAAKETLVVSKNTRLFLALGFIIRESLSFWTGHPFDVEIWIRTAYYVSRGANPYSFFPPAPGLSFSSLSSNIGTVGYLPLWPLMLSSLYTLFAVVGEQNRFLLYFLIKQPEVIGDVLLGYGLYRIILQLDGTPRAATSVLKFWMLSPFTIAVSAVWGQFDALVAFLWVFYLLIQDPARRSILIGIGILAKSLPLIILPYQILRDKFHMLWSSSLSLAVPIVFTTIVFRIFGWNYSSVFPTLANSAHGFPSGMTYTRLIGEPFILSIVEQIPGFLLVDGLIWIVVVFVAGLLASRLFPRQTAEDSTQASILIILFFFLSRWNVYEQYMIYLLAFMLIDISLWHSNKKALFQFTWIIAMIYLIVNNYFMIQFLGPVIPAATDPNTYSASSSVVWALRPYLLNVLALIFTVQLIQLILIMIFPRLRTRPWPLMISDRITKIFQSRLT